MKREFLMLAGTYNPDKHNIAGWFASIKRDGQRAFWDGGVTRGLDKRSVPWANTAKDERLISQPISTGLWSRYGNCIQAPDWWLDRLPKDICLDGELYIDRGLFQRTRSIVSKHTPIDKEWEEIQFLVFERPSPELVFESGRINNPQFVEKHIKLSDCMAHYTGSGRELQCMQMSQVQGYFEREPGNQVWQPMWQKRLPQDEAHARSKLMDMLMEETELGGEGIMLRNPKSYWIPKRTPNLLKVKPVLDSEGTVVGWNPGKGKLEGMMGNLVLEWRGQRFELSGFTDEERRLEEERIGRYPTHFPNGTIVTFKYMGLTDDGLPREARYFRK